MTNALKWFRSRSNWTDRFPSITQSLVNDKRPLPEQLERGHERPHQTRQSEHFPDGLHSSRYQETEAAGDSWDDNGNEYLWHQLTPGPLGFPSELLSLLVT